MRAAAPAGVSARPMGGAPNGPTTTSLGAYREESPVRSGSGTGGSFGSGLRQEYIDAFDDDVFGAWTPRPPVGGDAETEAETEPEAPEEQARRPKGGKGRSFAGAAAAAVTTVLAVVVAGHVAGFAPDRGTSRTPSDVSREDAEDVSRSDNRPQPSTPPAAAAASYEAKMAARYPLAPDLAGAGRFRTVPGHDKAPGRGQVVRYRVDVEQGLPLDGELFARAVQKTLNDERSWAHGGVRTFERVSGDDADWVITLASPGTTAAWCGKSGLDTTADNVSCDSASTPRIMINAYRWAQGAKTYGDDMHAYRQMLINHEVGHRLGRNHEGCPRQGALAPVMMQQTKFLGANGVMCKPNPWPYPRS